MNIATKQIGNPRVQGECPNGCGKTLFLGHDGYVTCSWIKCPDPCAPSKAIGVKFPDEIKNNV